MGLYTSDYERCPVDGSRLRDNKCSACGYLRKGARKERVIVDGKVYDADKVPGQTLTINASHGNAKANVGDSVFESAFDCDCGYSSTSAQAMRMHRQRAKVHKEPVNA